MVGKFKEKAARFFPDCVFADEEDCEISGFEDDAALHISISKLTVTLRSGLFDRKSLHCIANVLQSQGADLPPLHALRDSPDIGRHLAAWSSHLADAPLFADLPCDLVRSTAHNKSDPLDCLVLPGALTHLDPVELSVMVGFVFRAHCVRQEAILIGHVVEPCDDKLIGCRTNVVPLLVSSGQNLEAAVAQSKTALSSLPPVQFSVLAASLDPEGCAVTSSRTPLIQISCSMVDPYRNETDERCSAASSVCNCEISVQASSDGNVYWYFDNELFIAPTIRVFHDHLMAFATSKGASLMSSTELAFVSKGFCGSVVALPDKCEMHQFFVSKCPSQAPAVWESGVETSYSQLLERAQQVSAALSDSSKQVSCAVVLF